MGEYVEARSIRTAGAVLVALGALVPVLMSVLFPDELGGGDGVFVVVGVVFAASGVAVAVGAALVGASVVLRALEQAGVVRPHRRPPSDG